MFRPRDTRPNEYIPYPLREVVNVNKGMGERVRWPERRKTDEPKDLNKYCEFHWDHRHNMEQCYALRKEIVHLLKIGRLKEFMSDKGKEILDKVGNTKVRASSNHSKSPQTLTCTINMIAEDRSWAEIPARGPKGKWEKWWMYMVLGRTLEWKPKLSFQKMMPST